MSEAMMIWYIPLCGVLFAVGGTYNKAWRRFGIPLLTALVLFLCGVMSSKIAIVCGLLCGYLHLGYSPEKKKWIYIFGVLFSYTIPFVIIGLSIWQIITPITLLILMLMSNNKIFEKEVVWKCWELLAGMLIATTVVGILNHQW